MPFNERFAVDGDLERYAKDYVNFFRAFTEAVLKAALPETADRGKSLSIASMTGPLIC